MCPHTTIYVSSYYYICVSRFAQTAQTPTSRRTNARGAHTTINVSSYYYICVLILRYMCPHNPVLILLYVSSYSRPHTTIYVSSYSRPHTTTSYYYICVLILPLCTDRANPDQPSHERSGRWLTRLRKRLAGAGGGEFVREPLGLRVAVVAATQVCVL